MKETTTCKTIDQIELNGARAQTIEAIETGLEVIDNHLFKLGLELQYLEFIPENKRGEIDVHITSQRIELNKLKDLLKLQRKKIRGF